MPSNAACSRTCAAAIAFALASTAACGAPAAYEPPTVDYARSTHMPATLPRNPADRAVVTIYEFRSSVSEIGARGCTDMFKTALVKSGQFRVVERSRLGEGVVREKQLNASGLTDGNAAEPQLRAAQYIFEGTISGANPSESQRSTTVAIGGMELGGGKNRDVIVIDVSIVEVASGEIVDVVTVRKSVLSTTSSVSGVGNVVGALLTRGHGNNNRGNTPAALIPDIKTQDAHKESLDDALRAAIDLAVAELATRFRQ